MKEFDELIKTVGILLGPGGCPWDKEQTLKTLRSSVLEETCELIEAVDLDDNAHICEELGDLYFIVVFFCSLGEKEKRFSTSDVLKGINEKLIRRHPHIFGDVVIETSDQVRHQWEQIKQKEKSHRKSLLDGIPIQLPALMRAQKVLKKMAKTAFLQNKHLIEPDDEFDNEENLGSHLLAVAQKAAEKGIDAEQALRLALLKLETDFHAFERQNEKETYPKIMN